ncbi:MAG: type I restriction-modification system subunit M N-terminal domain-containing protein [Chamaesiphon sp.]|nr:type I restriction-modification system subunit M N-terminal domain-containing protein [Chamaesiphon sp.]
MKLITSKGLKCNYTFFGALGYFSQFRSDTITNIELDTAFMDNATNATLPFLPANQDEINNILWRACDTFRGTIDASEYKNYLLVMLFVKYVSDVWTERYEQLQQEFGDDKERILRRLERERFVLPVGCRFDDLYLQRNETNLGEIIDKVLEQIEESNKTKLSGVFTSVAGGESGCNWECL